jgi:Icc-related predicted phosphoesterase
MDQGAFQSLFARVPEVADILILCGDLTARGLATEARTLAKELADVTIPVVAVLGNHEFESGEEDEVRRIVADAAVTVLDGEACEIAGVGFAGVKGFGGGFGEHAYGRWGEPAWKGLVHGFVDEAFKLESALGRLRTPRTVVLLHYAPIRQTVEGEPPDIYPFLGSSHLEEPLTRYPVSAVIHGHAHAGAPEGRTRTGVPVYNVAMPLLLRRFPDRPPFRLVDLGEVTGG